MNVEGKKVLVVGTGKSGIAAAALLAKEKAAPVLFDENYTNWDGSTRVPFW